MKVSPILDNERIAVLDVIRGFAIFGIFLVNMPAFHSPDFIQQMYYLEENHSPLNQGIRLFFDLFVQAKFYTIFSFLFGIGFYIFIRRAEQKGHRTYRLFSRRLLILLCFGLFHLIFLWFGDILHTYALVGFLLLFFYKRSNRTIISWAFGLLFIFYALLSAQFLFEPTSFITQRQVDGVEKMNEAVQVYQNSSYTDWLTYRLKTEIPTILGNSPFMILNILPMFLFGLYAARRGIFQNPVHHKTFIKKVWFISLLFGAPLTVLVALLHFDVFSLGVRQWSAIRLFVSLNGFALCFFYISSITLLLQNSYWQKVMRPIGLVGQMALTNYLMQTILSLSIIFGFHLFNKMSMASGLLLCIGIYLFEVIFSSFWLKRYSFGPFEWLWRSLTYGSIQLLRRYKTNA